MEKIEAVSQHQPEFMPHLEQMNQDLGGPSWEKTQLCDVGNAVNRLILFTVSTILMFRIDTDWPLTSGSGKKIACE